MAKQFAGKSAFVTGGGSGIGRASALALAAQGALVTVAGRTEATLDETARLVEEAGGEARFVVADVTDEAQIEMALEAAVAGIGRLDIALNNAGYDGEFQLTQDYSTEMLDRMIALNVRGAFLSMKHELKYMVPQRSGAIVNMSSGAGLVGVAGFSGYAATKAAEVAMTKSSAVEAAPHGIRINAVAPGLVETPMIATQDPNEEPFKSIIAAHPFGRIARAAEIAEAVVWLSSDKASFVTGVVLPVDGGYTVP
ncbi:SDR family NAD(P)-dependent oxidoreductase [Rhodococcus tukisamuensis]|uniref:NAD(P)-dependent dehydrogenase, short-chain alcohol dehydrogenase family n=1 Tax=Rhodococcus tukisamuensis TaxID=168276 RepID=A0A1G6QI29_9NOCA|nr:glucose 1-dehydrogenase [Rhodococcus tukisamuensis]SDC91337.1 NAD(P)-dependent dehydrogenase, short-chain alcohol dehydrogenase family [Rhodococcus tukisamuensis]